MQKKLVFTSAALFAAVFLMGATPTPQPVAPTAPKPVAAMTTPAAAPIAAMQPAMVPMAVAPAKPATVKPAPKQDKLGSVVGGALLQILLVVLTIAVPIVLTPFIKWLLKKMKVEDLQTVQLVDGIVDQAIVVGLNYANEQAHKLGDNPIKGAEKLAVARDKAIEYLKDSGIVNKGAEYIEGLIEAKLGESRETEAMLASLSVEKPAAESEDEEGPTDDDAAAEVAEDKPAEDE